jgi:hypothetical protein
MARNSQQERTVPSTPVVAAPEGFRRLGSVANAGWFDMKTIGNTLKGVLEGMYERKDDLNPKKVSNFFQVRITTDCQVRMGRGEDADIVTAKSGDYVNLNYGPKTKDLEKLIADISLGAVYEVFGVVAGEKIKLTGGRTMHNFEVFTKMTRAPQSIEDSEPDFTEPTDDSATA